MQGIDIIAWRGGSHTIVQCKAWRNAIGPAVVRELYGALMAHDEADAGDLVTTSRLTADASRFLEGKRIQVWTLEDILQG
jgi:restriction system protein